MVGFFFLNPKNAGFQSVAFSWVAFPCTRGAPVQGCWAEVTFGQASVDVCDLKLAPERWLNCAFSLCWELEEPKGPEGRKEPEGRSVGVFLIYSRGSTRRRIQSALLYEFKNTQGSNPIRFRKLRFFIMHQVRGLYQTGEHAKSWHSFPHNPGTK